MLFDSAHFDAGRTEREISMAQNTVTVVNYEQATDSFFYRINDSQDQREIAADTAFRIWEDRESFTESTDLEKRLIAAFMNLDWEEPCDLVNQTATL